MNTTELYIYYTVLTLIWFEFFWEIMLLFRQRRVISKNTQVPTPLMGIMSQKEFDKARDYARDINTYTIISDTYLFLVSMGIMFCKCMPYFWGLADDIIKRLGFETGEMSQGAVFMTLLNTFNSISLLPFSIYHTFVLEEKYGFNNQTVSFFICDRIKHYILQVVLLVPLMCGVSHIVKIGGDFFVFYAWFFILGSSVILYTIYPDFIAPWFDKYTPLPSGTLKTELEKLAESVEFPLAQISVIEGSKRSAHSNAFIFGAFNLKKIVIFDNLIKELLEAEAKDEDKQDSMEKRAKEKEKTKGEKSKGCEVMEVVAIVAHELGHWKHRHIAKKMVGVQLNVFVCFALFSFFMKYEGIYERFGFDNGAPIMISLIIVLHFILLPYFGLFAYVLAIMGRYAEFEADRFAKSLGKTPYLKSALIKLNHDNLGFPIYDPLYSSWHNSHPPLLERLQALDKDD